eukprot:1310405-Alexandrium_andersonii.AAC.1
MDAYVLEIVEQFVADPDRLFNAFRRLDFCHACGVASRSAAARQPLTPGAGAAAGTAAAEPAVKSCAAGAPCSSRTTGWRSGA